MRASSVCVADVGRIAAADSGACAGAAAFAQRALPARVEEVCLRALAKDPAQRFRTADDFARAVQAAAEPQRSRLPLLAMVAALIALAAISLWQLRKQPVAPAAAVAPPLRRRRRRCRQCTRVSTSSMRTARCRTAAAASAPRRRSTRMLCGTQPAGLFICGAVFQPRAGPGVVAPGGATERSGPRIALPRCPAEGEDKLTIPSGGGVMTMLVAGREKPLDAASLHQLTAEPFKWPSPRHAEPFPATAFPPLPLAERFPNICVLRDADARCSICRESSSRWWKISSTRTMR